MGKKKLYLLAFFVPVILLLGVMYFCSVTPFGDRTVLRWDALLQHKDYYGYLWDVLHGDATIGYSAAKSLGGRMIGIIGFYISSPLNILLLLFPKNQIPLFMAVMIVLRVGLCGVTCAYYLQHRFALTPFSTILLSMSYALSEYNVVNCRNVMWLDGVIFLPLVAAGIWKIIKSGKPFLFWLSIALVIICNWYTGYMVCLMSGIYFVYEFMLYEKFNIRHALSNGWRTIFQYLSSLLLGVMASMAVLLPACMSLIGGKATNNLVFFSNIWHFDLIHFLSGFDVSAAFNAQSAPIIFCGTVVLILVICYFFCHSVPNSERIWSAALVLLLALSFCLQDLELLWTAYVQSSSYYFRFAFVFIFVMIMLAGRGLQLVEQGAITWRELLKSIALIVCGVYILRRGGEWRSPSSLLRVYISAFAIILLLTWRIVKTQRARVALAVFVFLCAAAEMSYNAEMAFLEYNVSARSFADYTDKIEKLVNKLDKGADGEFYRFEKDFSWIKLLGRDVATGESFLYGYNSIEHYSSAYDIAVDRFLGDMGYSDYPEKNNFLCETYWNSPMILTDSLLSIKYVLLDNKCYGYDAQDTIEPFYDNQVLENRFALPFGYNVSGNLGDIKFGPNPYENQNILVKAMLGDYGTEVRPMYKNVKVLSQSLNKKGNEVCKFIVDNDGPVYVFVDGRTIHNLIKKNCTLYCNGKIIQETICKRFNINSIYLGNFAAGENVKLVIKHKTDKKKKHKLYVAQLDTEAFEDAIGKLSAGSSSTLNIEGNVISGTYSTEKDATIFLSIPYEKNWKCRVDGEQVELKKLANTFIGIDVKAGTHDINIVYSTPGLRTGIVLSVLGVLIFAGLQLRGKQRLALCLKSNKPRSQ